MVAGSFGVVCTWNSTSELREFLIEPIQGLRNCLVDHREFIKYCAFFRKVLRVRDKNLLARMLPLGMQTTCTVFGTVSGSPQVTKRSVECGGSVALKLQVDTVFAFHGAPKPPPAFTRDTLSGMRCKDPPVVPYCPRVTPCEEVSNSAAETGSTGWTIFLTSHHCHAPPRNLNLG